MLVSRNKPVVIRKGFETEEIVQAVKVLVPEYSLEDLFADQ